MVGSAAGSLGGHAVVFETDFETLVIHEVARHFGAVDHGGDGCRGGGQEEGELGEHHLSWGALANVLAIYELDDGSDVNELMQFRPKLNIMRASDYGDNPRCCSAPSLLLPTQSTSRVDENGSSNLDVKKTRK